MKKIFLFALLLFAAACTGKKAPPNIILLPKTLDFDVAHSRLFVADSEDNGFSLIELVLNKIVTGKPLLNKDSALRLPELPQDLAVANLGGDTSRIFIVGNGPTPRNRVVVFDYDLAGGLRAAPISPIVVGADDASDQSDLLLGLALDAGRQILFVSNGSDGLIRAYDVNTGAEVAGSPLTVNPSPSKISIDESIDRLFVSSLGSTAISVVHLDDLSVPPDSFDVGLETGSVAAATVAAGTVLFVVSPTDNEIRVFKLDLTDLTLSVPIGDPIIAPAAGQPDAPNVLLSGAAVQVAAAPLTDGRLAAFITQSTGDLGFIDVTADLTSFATGRTAVLNGQGAQDLQILKDELGNGLRTYFAAPGGSTVTFTNSVTNLFVGQIF